MNLQLREFEFNIDLTNETLQGGKLAAQYDKASKDSRSLEFKAEWEKTLDM
jgi:hypothetical protein